MGRSGTGKGAETTLSHSTNSQSNPELIRSAARIIISGEFEGSRTFKRLQHHPTNSVTSEPEQVDPNRARKVAEVFLTAGHAFQKLGDLTMQLHIGPSSYPTEERWSDNHVEHLREALTRFAHELDQISNSVQARTTKIISTDIRRRHLAPQRPILSAMSNVRRQPAKLGPVMVPKRMNVSRNVRQYMPGRLPATPATVSQVVVSAPKNYPLTKATTTAFGGQRQYMVPLSQAGPSRAVPTMTSRLQNQGAIHQNTMMSHQAQGPPTLVPVMLEESPPRLDQRS